MSSLTDTLPDVNSSGAGAIRRRAGGGGGGKGGAGYRNKERAVHKSKVFKDVSKAKKRSGGGDRRQFAR